MNKPGISGFFLRLFTRPLQKPLEGVSRPSRVVPYPSDNSFPTGDSGRSNGRFRNRPQPQNQPAFVATLHLLKHFLPMPETLNFHGDAFTFLGFIGVVSSFVILVTAFRRFYRSPYNFTVKNTKG